MRSASIRAADVVHIEGAQLAQHKIRRVSRHARSELASRSAWQILFVLHWVFEVVTSDGEKQRWSAGWAFISSDLTSKGTSARVIEGLALLAFVELSPDFISSDCRVSCGLNSLRNTHIVRYPRADSSISS